MDALELAKTLQSAGGWGLSSILMLVIAFLARTIYKMVQQKEAESKEQNQKLFEMMEKRISTDIEHRESFKQLRETVKELIPLLRRG